MSLREFFLAGEVTVPPVPLYSVERKVKEIMHKAFWDCLEAQLMEDPPSYGHAIKLLAEIKEVRFSLHSRSRTGHGCTAPYVDIY